MDERQTKIVEGAGLEESRVNQELLDFLNRWSFPALLVVALISAGYYVYNMMEQRRITQRDEAFGQFAAVEGAANPSVFSLTEIADQFEGVGSVAELARLRAADVHMNAVRTGMDPSEEGKELTQEDRVYRLEQAESLYRRVYESASGSAGKALFAANAAFGLAAIAETRGDMEEARLLYGEAKSFAERAGYTPLAGVAEKMVADIDELGDPTLYSQADLPRLPFEPEPQPETPLPGPETPGPDAPGPDTPGDGAPADGDLGVDSSLNLTPPPPPAETPAGDPPADDPDDG